MPGVLVGWLLTRALLIGALFGWVPYPDGPLMMSDVRLYAVWSIVLADGQFPVGDDMWQYPPAAGVIFAAARYLWTDAVTGFVLLTLIADLAILIALIVAARRRSRPLLAPWIWVGAALAIGPIMLARFDVFPTLFAVAVLLLIARPVSAGVAAGIGFLVKVWPALMLIALPRRSIPPAAIAVITVIVAGWWAVGQWASGAVSFLGEQGGRGLQIESVGALPYVVLNMAGGHTEYAFRFGSLEVDMAGSRELGLTITIAGLLVIAGLAVLRLAGRLETVPPGDVAITALLISVATSRVFSPQYSVWIAGVAAVALLDQRTRMRGVVIALGVMALLTQVIYPWGYGSLIDGSLLSGMLQVVRISLLVGATGYATFVVVKTGLRRSSADDATHSREVSVVPGSEHC